MKSEGLVLVMYMVVGSMVVRCHGEFDLAPLFLYLRVKCPNDIEVVVCIQSKFTNIQLSKKVRETYPMG